MLETNKSPETLIKCAAIVGFKRGKIPAISASGAARLMGKGEGCSSPIGWSWPTLKWLRYAFHTSSKTKSEKGKEEEKE